MKIVVIYHSVDLDGYMSAAIVKHWFNTTKIGRSGTFKDDSSIVIKPFDTLTFIGHNYGQPIPNLSEYDKVIMCDISFKLTKGKEIDRIGPMFDLVTKLRDNFIWIDHHISAINDIINYADEYDHDNAWPVGLRNTKFAACELTWKYFFPYTPMPEIVRLLGRYDCFGHKGTFEEQDVLEFQYGARQVISNYEDAYDYLLRCLISKSTEDHHMIMIMESGRAIYKYLCQEAKQTYATKFDLVFNDDTIISPRTNESFIKRKFAAINKNRFNPINFGIDYHADGYDGVACFWYEQGKLCFSLYNDNGLVDCSAIAKQYGGGGHKGASGFVLKPTIAVTGERIMDVRDLVAILGSLKA